MSFGEGWGSGFYSGGGASADVPGRFPFAIAGRAYMLDTRPESGGVINGDIAVQRPQVDDSARPGEASLSTEGLWRRTVESWHKGAGQRFYDWGEADPYRFDTSTGLDPWTEKELRLLPTTTLARAAIQPELHLAVAAGRLYLTDGSALRYTTDLVTWTNITGQPPQVAVSLATNGQHVWVAYGPAGVYQVAPGAAVMTSYTTGQVDAVGYAKGRLFAFTNGTTEATVYNVTAPGALPTPLSIHPAASFPTGSPVAEGPNAAYLVGQVGDKPLILRTAVEEDGSGMTVPAVAGHLPDGQVARSVAGYLGSVLLVGTDDRVWLLDFADGAGNLVTRGSIPVDEAVHAFEPQDRFAWYGGRDGGLYRLDLATNTADDAFSPGYATDLHSGTIGPVRSVATYDGRRVLTVEGRGVYVESPVPVTVGVVDLGVIGFGIGDLKNALYADVRHEPLPAGASVLVEVAKDGDPFTVAGTSGLEGSVSATVELGQLLAESIRLRVTLSGGAVLRSVTARAAPAPTTGELWQFPILLHRRVEDLHGGEHHYDILAERDFLRGLRAGRTAVTVQHGALTFTGLVDRLAEWREESRAYDDNGQWTGAYSGVQVVVFKVV